MPLAGRRALVIATVVAASVLIPSEALAATSGTATASLPMLGGSLSIGTLTGGTLPNATPAGGADSGSLSSATWSDTTGLGAGWNGTLSLATALTYDGPWTPSGSAPALTATSSGAYSGTAGNALLTVTVTAGTPTVTTVSWSDREAAGTTTTGLALACTNGSPCTISNGVTITFNAATLYTTGEVYTAHDGALPSTAVALSSANAIGPTATGTTVGGSNLPTLQNSGSTVPGNGTAVKFVSAAAQAGMGTFTIAPGVTVSGWDPNNIWGGTGVVYSAQAQYTISTGP